jgi:hypothetical protein
MWGDTVQYKIDIEHYMSTQGVNLVGWLWQKHGISLFPSQSRWGIMQVFTTAIMGFLAIAISFLAVWIACLGNKDMTVLWWVSTVLGIFFSALSLGAVYVMICLFLCFRDYPNAKSSDEYLEEISKNLEHRKGSGHERLV